MLESLLRKQRYILFNKNRVCIKALLDQNMKAFSRERTKNETYNKIVSGLPLGDRGHNNKCVYGEIKGNYIGFMDDLTPCRINKSIANIPCFYLDSRFMKVRTARCFSGLADNRSYTAHDLPSAQVTFLWFAIARTFAQCGYPMWADSLELWKPEIPENLQNLAMKYSFAIGLAENECVETTFPANNPVEEAPEISVNNPLSPNNPDSFWNQHMKQYFG